MPTLDNGTPLRLSADDLLQRLAAACDAVESPVVPLPPDRFDASHERFERSSSQQGEILNCLRRLGVGARRSGEPLSVLSIGPGNGMLDLPLISALADGGIATEYVGVDPSRVAGQRFRDGFESIDPSDVSLSLHACGVDELEGGEAFDLIHAVHSIYYVEDPPATLARLLGRVRPGGRLVVFQAPRGVLNELAECFWRGGDGRSVWFSDRLESWLNESGLGFEKRRIDAQLEVTRVLDLGDPEGRLVLDFILHTASDRLDEPILGGALQYLRSISRCESDRWFAPHPVDAFVVSPD